jgi:hypothetical protein
MHIRTFDKLPGWRPTCSPESTLLASQSGTWNPLLLAADGAIGIDALFAGKNRSGSWGVSDFLGNMTVGTTSCEKVTRFFEEAVVGGSGARITVPLKCQGILGELPFVRDGEDEATRSRCCTRDKLDGPVDEDSAASISAAAASLALAAAGLRISTLFLCGDRKSTTGILLARGCLPSNVSCAGFNGGNFDASSAKCMEAVVRCGNISESYEIHGC